MSSGNICKAKIKISNEQSSFHGSEIGCRLWEGHEGNHKANLYRTRKKDEGWEKTAYVGELEWTDEQSY